MAIKIKHRFYERLKPTEKINSIDILIIGTFNPGNPEAGLNETELNEFNEINHTAKYIEFNNIMNFYDRSNNRFWKIMDYFNCPDFYIDGDFRKVNKNGLKYYKNANMDRNLVFCRQNQFCLNKNMFITDIVKEIQPESFRGIYQNFSDKVIDKSNCSFNTDDIIKIINDFKPKKIIKTFNININTIPNISNELQKIKTSSKREFCDVFSPSGSTRYSYNNLIKNWGKIGF